jgi:hypothetical protein
LNRELDSLAKDNITGVDLVGGLSLTLPDDASEIKDEPSSIMPHGSRANQSSKKRPKSASSCGRNSVVEKGQRNVEDDERDFYNNLVLSPDGKTINKPKGDSDSHSRVSRTNRELKTPYADHLPLRERKAIHRGDWPIADSPGKRKRSGSSSKDSRSGINVPPTGLHTSSDTSIDAKSKGSRGVFSLGKNLFTRSKSKSRGNPSVVPFNEARPDWIDPNTKDYRKKEL